VSAIGRFLAVLEALSGRPEGSRITELARDTDLPKSTLHRTVGEMHGLTFHIRNIPCPRRPNPATSDTEQYSSFG